MLAMSKPGGGVAMNDGDSSVSGAHAPPRCTAKSKRTGKRCKGPPSKRGASAAFMARAAVTHLVMIIRLGGTVGGRRIGLIQGERSTIWCERQKRSSFCFQAARREV